MFLHMCIVYQDIRRFHFKNWRQMYHKMQSYLKYLETVLSHSLCLPIIFSSILLCFCKFMHIWSNVIKWVSGHVMFWWIWLWVGCMNLPKPTFLINIGCVFHISNQSLVKKNPSKSETLAGTLKLKHWRSMYVHY